MQIHSFTALVLGLALLAGCASHTVEHLARTPSGRVVQFDTFDQTGNGSTARGHYREVPEDFSSSAISPLGFTPRLPGLITAPLPEGYAAAQHHGGGPVVGITVPLVGQPVVIVDPQRSDEDTDLILEELRRQGEAIEGLKVAKDRAPAPSGRAE